MNHVDKYYWVVDHPKLGGTAQAVIEMNPQQVNPENNEISLDHPELNTKFEWWVEVLVWDEDSRSRCHDWEVDTGGDTAEEAIHNLYDLVLKTYGGY
jgi:hypothetical protein